MLKGLLGDEADKGKKVQSIIYRSGREARQRLMEARAQLDAEEAVYERAKFAAKTMRSDGFTVGDKHGVNADDRKEEEAGSFEQAKKAAASQSGGSSAGIASASSNEVLPFTEGIGASLRDDSGDEVEKKNTTEGPGPSEKVAGGSNADDTPPSALLEEKEDLDDCHALAADSVGDTLGPLSHVTGVNGGSKASSRK